MTHYRELTLFVLSALVAFGGCSGTKLPNGMPPLHPLTVTLIQEGHPLSGADIFLLPETGDSVWNIGGVSDHDGKVVPMTHGKYKGVPAGRYKACVSKVEATTVAGRSLPDEYDLVDPKLKSPQTTALTLEVGPGKNNITLDVGKPVKTRIDTGGA